MTVFKDIEKMKKRLITKAKKQGLYENFGQKEVGILEDKYGYVPPIAEFDDWCASYTGK